MQTIKPAKNQLFVQPLEAAKVTKSGFILPEASLNKPKMAKIINVGSGVEDFEPNDVVVYKEYTTTVIKLDDKEYLLIADEDILGTVIDV